MKDENTVAEDKKHYDGVDEKSNGMENPTGNSVEVTIVTNGPNQLKQFVFPKKE